MNVTDSYMGGLFMDFRSRCTWKGVDLHILASATMVVLYEGQDFYLTLLIHQIHKIDLDVPLLRARLFHRGGSEDLVFPKASSLYFFHALLSAHLPPQVALPPSPSRTSMGGLPHIKVSTLGKGDVPSYGDISLKKKLNTANLKLPEISRMLRGSDGFSRSTRTLLWLKVMHLRPPAEVPAPVCKPTLLQENGYHQIQLDVPRTFPEILNDRERQVLTNILRRFVDNYPEVGYCQGLNFVVLPFMFYVNFSEDQMLAGVSLITHQLLVGYHSHDLHGLLRDCEIFAQVCQLFLPTFWQSGLAEFQVEVMHGSQKGALEWFILEPMLTLFQKNLMFHEGAHLTAITLMDILLVEGKPGLFASLLAALQLFLQISADSGDPANFRDCLQEIARNHRTEFIRTIFDFLYFQEASGYVGIRDYLESY